jgi:predicted HicB family RNase H-like nuclease
MSQKIERGTMEYRGFRACFEWDEEDLLYSGEIEDTWGTVIFEARTLEETAQAFTEALDWHLEKCLEINQEPRQSSIEALAHSI